MAPRAVDPDRIQSFEDRAAFEAWLESHHDTQTELWIRLFKVKSGVGSVTIAETIDVALCWGWIDGIKKSFDEASFLQRFTPRGAKSVWSQVNVANVARLIDEGRMTPHGLRHVEAAKADGRWDAAYRIKGASLPDDLAQAIAADPEAQAFYEGLTAQNRFALIYRVQTLKTPAGRAKAIARLVEMLRRGETFHPQKRP